MSLTDVVQKVWGTDECLHRGPASETHLLRLRDDVESGQPVKCSDHVHSVKWNRFYVLSGSMLVGWWDYEDRYHVLVLSEGESHTVAAGLKHHFTTAGSAKAIECVWTCGLEADINRFNEGCVIHEQA